MTISDPPWTDLHSAETPALRLERVVSRLTSIRDPQARLAWLVDLARKRQPLDARHRLDANRVSGCMVRTWWIAGFEDGRCRFLTDSDAVTLKATAGLIADICSGGTPEEVAATDFEFLDASGLLRQMAENRQATIRKIARSAKEFAAAVR